MVYLTHLALPQRPNHTQYNSLTLKEKLLCRVAPTLCCFSLMRGSNIKICSIVCLACTTKRLSWELLMPRKITNCTSIRDSFENTAPPVPRALSLSRSSQGEGKEHGGAQVLRSQAWKALRFLWQELLITGQTYLGTSDECLHGQAWKENVDCGEWGIRLGHTLLYRSLYAEACYCWAYVMFVSQCLLQWVLVNYKLSRGNESNRLIHFIKANFEWKNS